MAEIIVKNEVCSVCGADVRKNALFCYNCGSSVAPEIIAPKTDKIDVENHTAVKKDFAGNGQKASRTELKIKPENESALLRETAEKPIPKSVVEPETNLKSAASLRKKSKSVQKKKVEIIWEEHENAPNVWFVLSAVLLTVFTAVVMWLALYFG